MATPAACRPQLQRQKVHQQLPEAQRGMLNGLSRKEHKESSGEMSKTEWWYTQACNINKSHQILHLKQVTLMICK